MNTYNIYDKKEPSCVLFHAIANTPSEVMELAEKKGIDLSGLEIELERSNVRDEMGRPYAASITDAVVR